MIGPLAGDHLFGDNKIVVGYVFFNFLVIDLWSWSYLFGDNKMVVGHFLLFLRCPHHANFTFRVFELEKIGSRSSLSS